MPQTPYNRRARRTRRPLIALLVLLALLGVGYTSRALDGGRAGPAATNHSSTAPAATDHASIPSAPTDSPTTAAAPTSGAVALSTLPEPARHTVALIRAGGPFPYQRDGVVFRNDERRLPARPSGYYHEYTVPTPGETDRGPRRIIAGSLGELYYTPDHYASFVRVDAGH